MKVSELTGALLDLWVAKAEDLPLCAESMQSNFIMVGTGEGDLRHFSPSTEWNHGGPIIEREHILLDASFISKWHARSGRHSAFGQTALIAAMRAYVAGKFGEEIAEVPE